MITRARALADELLEERFPVGGLFGVTDDERPRRLAPRLRLSTAPPRREP